VGHVIEMSGEELGTGGNGMQGKKRALGQPAKVMLVDDHPIVRRGLAQLINQEEDLRVCSEVGSASEAIARLSETTPEALIVDISLAGANGIELTKSLSAKHPDLPVLVLSMHDESLYAERALKAGARGYVMKQEPAETVLEALRTILNGGIYVSKRVASQLLRGVNTATPEEPVRSGVDRLSDRELEIFELIGNGLPTRAVADKLGLSVKTIETHRAHIKHKLQLRNANELIHHAVHWVENHRLA
jgi:DNA-binding NarL/FixJ family response regulator